MQLVNFGNVTIDTSDNDTLEFRDALCKYTDPEIFFPTTTGNQQAEHLNDSNRTAIEICKSCKHEVDCAAYALVRPRLYGIWGGLTNTDRKRIRKEYGITGISDSSDNNDDINSD
jgi:WhiB family redox-sensing transcriptional regulator